MTTHAPMLKLWRTSGTGYPSRFFCAPLSPTPTLYPTYSKHASLCPSSPVIASFLAMTTGEIGTKVSMLLAFNKPLWKPTREPKRNYIAMPDFVKLATADLVDLLAQETEKFTRLMGNKEFTPEYEECKETIQQLIAIIESRKETTVSGPGVTFSEPDTTN
jgi:hypothetical protein